MRTGIVTFAFGQPADSRTNGKLAAITTAKARELQAPVFTQNDIIPEEDVVAVRIMQEPEEGPPPTLRIARVAVEWAKLGGLRELRVIAAQPHIRRCLRDLRRAALETGVHLDVQPVEKLEEYRWYDPTSTQERVQSRAKWWPRELILRTLPFALYKRVAG